MARNKAIFDADILINVVKTKSVEYLISVFEQIYVSDYVWNCEIKEDTQEYPVLKSMLNRGFIKILEFSKLTVVLAVSLFWTAEIKLKWTDKSVRLSISP